jgi:hypothetical protein
LHFRARFGDTSKADIHFPHFPIDQSLRKVPESTAPRT